MTTPIQIGSIVTLTSGGWPMTVYDVSNGVASVVWMDANGTAQRAGFPIVALQFYHAPLPPLMA